MMLSKTKRTLMWIAMTITIIVVVCWILYVAYVDFVANDATSKGQQYQQAYQQWSGPAASGDNIAQYRLGELHEKGLGVPVNPVEAHVWYELSALGGLDASKAALARLKTTMQPTQIEEAERLLVSYANVLVEADTPSAIGPTTTTAELLATPTESTVTSSVANETQLASTPTTTAGTTNESTTSTQTVYEPPESDSALPIVTGTVVVTPTTEDIAQEREEPVPQVNSNITEAIQRADDASGNANTAVIASTEDESRSNFPTLSVCETQQMLSQLGYSVGTVDGLFGNQTASAIRNYQQSTGLATTGVIDRTLIASLLSLPWDGASIRAICSQLGA